MAQETVGSGWIFAAERVGTSLLVHLVDSKRTKFVGAVQVFTSTVSHAAALERRLLGRSAAVDAMVLDALVKCEGISVEKLSRYIGGRRFPFLSFKAEASTTMRVLSVTAAGKSAAMRVELLGVELDMHFVRATPDAADPHVIAGPFIGLSKDPEWWLVLRRMDEASWLYNGPRGYLPTEKLPIVDQWTVAGVSGGAVESGTLWQALEVRVDLRSPSHSRTFRFVGSDPNGFRTAMQEIAGRGIPRLTHDQLSTLLSEYGMAARAAKSTAEWTHAALQPPPNFGAQLKAAAIQSDALASQADDDVADGCIWSLDGSFAVELA